MLHSNEQRAHTYASALLPLFIIAGCTSNPPQAAPPPPKVTVVNPVKRTVIDWDEFTGRLDAVDFVEVRARVGGMIMSMPFPEGSLVHEGDLLVEIDARPFQAELNARIADADDAAAQVELASIEMKRIQGISKESRARTEMDTATASLKKAEAILAGAKARVESARLNVEWCRVTAPITGRVSRRLVTAGNLITGGSGQGTLLTTITSVDPIYCYIDADERSVLKYASMARSGARVSARQARIQCALQLADESNFPHPGIVDFVDNRADPNTGTVRGRGVFPNKDGWLLPGFFARVRIPGSGRYEALLVPDDAVVTDQSDKTLLVVDDKNVVVPRVVKLGSLFGTLRAVASGINPSDRVITNGLMQARPGAVVDPVPGAIDPRLFPPELPPAEPEPERLPMVPTTTQGDRA